MTELSKDALAQVFLAARTHSAWQDKEVPAGTLERLYEIARMGPTSMNCSPLRVHFVVSPEAKEKLKPCLSPGNVDKTMAAPATAILGYDLEFYETLSKLVPHKKDARAVFAGRPALIFATAFRNSSLQGAYFIIAARALGLDCGPMSGFNEDKLNAAFFPDGRIKANFLCNLGYGEADKLHPRAPRLDFEEACLVL